MSTSDVSPPQLPSPSQQRLAMAPALKLYAPSANKNAAKALIAAEYNGVKLDQPPFEMGVTNKTPAFLKLNPFGKARGTRLPAGSWPEHGATRQGEALCGAARRVRRGCAVR